MSITVLDDLGVLVETLQLKNEVIHPDFFIFRFDDCFSQAECLDTVLYRDFFEIAIVLDSNGIVKLGDLTFKDLTNTISFISPNQLFSYIAPKEKNKTSGFAIFFRSTFFNPQKHNFEILNAYPFFRIHTLPVFKLKGRETSELLELFQKIHDESIYNGIDSIKIIESYLIIILSKLKQISNMQLESVTISRAEQIANGFEELLIKSKKKSIAEYAHELNISQIYLTECVKKVTRKTPKQILIDYQVLEAKSMLHQSDLSITQIALELGFDEGTNFTKFFKKHTGTTPKQFRSYP